MLFIGWAVGLALLVLAFGNWEERQFNPNSNLQGQTLEGAREVTLQGNRFHHYVATGEINGRKVTFLLDTGATDVVVPAGLAEDLGLQPGARAYAQTANGTVEIRRTMIRELTLGPIRFEDVRASINPGMSGKEILLGMSALRQVELIQKGTELTLRQYAP
ncbi:retropepsin-like aspartic protease family protein [Gilvimarinus sp. F26214L]|uniref:retropepsin-like aspartic protease family protein n=1 Tax=Gilvimarinus sp. DZF01 TaxID=3461371 RepID=UPI004045FDDE